MLSLILQAASHPLAYVYAIAVLGLYGPVANIQVGTTDIRLCNEPTTYILNCCTMFACDISDDAAELGVLGTEHLRANKQLKFAHMPNKACH